MKNYLLPLKISRIYSISSDEKGTTLIVEKGETFLITSGYVQPGNDYAVFTPEKKFLYTVSEKDLSNFVPGSED